MADNITTTTPTSTTTDTSIATPAEAEVTTDDTEVEDAEPEAKPETKAEKTSKKKLKLKVDGKEIEEEFDFDDDESLIRDKQLARVAQKRMAEHAQLQKEVREWIDQLRKNPRAVLSDPELGLDLKQFAASIIQEEIENSQKSPEVLEKEKMQKELSDERAQREKLQEEYKQKEFERIQEREFERVDMLMSQALEKTDLPKSPYVIKKMADYMLIGLQKGLDVTPEDVLPMVREEIMTDIKAMFGAMPEEVIEKMLGKETISKLRKRSLARAKTAPTPVSKSIVDSGKKADEKKDTKPKKTFREFFGT